MTASVFVEPAYIAGYAGSRKNLVLSTAFTFTVHRFLPHVYEIANAVNNSAEYWVYNSNNDSSICVNQYAV